MALAVVPGSVLERVQEPVQVRVPVLVLGLAPVQEMALVEAWEQAVALVGGKEMVVAQVPVLEQGRALVTALALVTARASAAVAVA